MTFQSTIRQLQTTGLAGEIAREGPKRVEPWNLLSGGPNPIGFAYTQVSDGNVELGGSGAFVGILVSPKEHALIGTAGDTLAANNTLADNVQASLLGMGIIYVNLTSAANVVGDAITYNTTTGALSTTAVSGTQIAFGAKLILEDIPDANGLAIIQLTN